MRYAEYPPHPRLASHIRCYWVFEHQFGKDESNDDRIVPDGSPELIFHFGDPYAEIGEDGTAAKQPRSLFAGQITGPLLLRSSGHAGVIGIRFQPWGARRFIDLPMHQAVDRRIDLSELWGPVLDPLHVQLDQADNDQTRIAAIEQVLLEISDHGMPLDDADVALCVYELQAAQGAHTMDRLLAKTHLGERQLERRFKDIVGLSSRTLGAILRFRSLFDAFEHSSDAPWLRAAIETGYFDQAHMIRDFKRFAGRPPQAFYQSLSGLSANMVGNVGSVQDSAPPVP